MMPNDDFAVAVVAALLLLAIACLFMMFVVIKVKRNATFI